MRFTLFTLISLLVSAQAHAAGSGRSNTPEYFYQPNNGNLAVSLGYESQMGGANTTSVNGAVSTNNTYTHTAYGAKLAYALSDAWAVNGAVKMASDQVTQSSPGSETSLRDNGMSDIGLMLTNITPLSAWSLNVGVGALLSSGKHKEHQTWADGNQVSGGTSIVNYVGLSTIVGSANYFGVKLQYLTRTERTVNNNSTTTPADYKLTGGNEFTLGTFFEFAWPEVSIDFSGAANFIDPVSILYADGSQASGGVAYHTYALGLGLQYQMTASSNFRVSYDMTMYPDRTNSSVTESAYTAALLAARLRFEF